MKTTSRLALARLFVLSVNLIVGNIVLYRLLVRIPAFSEEANRRAFCLDTSFVAALLLLVSFFILNHGKRRYWLACVLSFLVAIVTPILGLTLYAALDGPGEVGINGAALTVLFGMGAVIGGVSLWTPMFAINSAFFVLLTRWRHEAH